MSGCRTWRIGVPSYSTHWMGLKTTPSCDPWIWNSLVGFSGAPRCQRFSWAVFASWMRGAPHWFTGQGSQDGLVFSPIQ